METNNILQLLKEASSELKSYEMLVSNDEYKIPSNDSDSKEDQNSIKNYKQTFAFNITNAKHVGHFKYNPKPIFIESNLKTILKNRSFYQAKDGQIKYYEVPDPTSLTLKQIRDIIIKLLFAQYDVFDGFSPYQTFFTCLYLYKDLYPNDLDQQYKDNPKYLKAKLLKTGVLLFLLTFFKVQCIANHIYNPNDIFTKEWSTFDFEKDEDIFRKHELLLSDDEIKSLIKDEHNKVIHQQTQPKKIPPEEKIQEIFIDKYKKINNDIGDLLSLKNRKRLSKDQKNPLYAPTANETLEIILYERQIAEFFIYDRIENRKKIDKKLPNLINDTFENAPGFCSVLDYPDTGIKLFSDIKSYQDMKDNKYQKMIDDIISIDEYLQETTKPSKIEEITDIFIDWNSTHTETITAVRFYFFRKFFPFYTSEKWDINLIRPKGHESSPISLSQFVSDTFDKTKNLPVDNLHRVKMLFIKFYTFCLRVLIFRPYKLQKSLLKTVITQWVRNIYQIYKFDNSQKLTKNQVFTKRMKGIFYDILHADFKYYFSYCFITGIYEKENPKDMLFIYSFLFLNLVLSPYYSYQESERNQLFLQSDFVDAQTFNGERIIDICIYRLSLDLILYQYIKNEKNNKNSNKNVSNAMKDLIGSFRQNFFFIQKNIKKFYQSTTVGSSNEFNIDEIFDQFKNYIANFYQKRHDDLDEFKKVISNSINSILKKTPSVKISFSIKQKAIDRFCKMIDENKNECVIIDFLNDPLNYRFDFQTAPYPYLVIEKIPQQNNMQ